MTTARDAGRWCSTSFAKYCRCPRRRHRHAKTRASLPSVDDVASLVDTMRSRAGPITWTDAGRAPSARAGGVAGRLPDRPGGAHQRVQARRRRRPSRQRATATAWRSPCRIRATGVREHRFAHEMATGSSACVSGRRRTAARSRLGRHRRVSAYGPGFRSHPSPPLHPTPPRHGRDSPRRARRRPGTDPGRVSGDHRLDRRSRGGR